MVNFDPYKLILCTCGIFQTEFLFYSLTWSLIHDNIGLRVLSVEVRETSELLICNPISFLLLYVLVQVARKQV
jgi:hypothetical protein